MNRPMSWVLVWAVLGVGLLLSGCAPLKRLHNALVPECSEFSYPDSFGRQHYVGCPL